MRRHTLIGERIISAAPTMAEVAKLVRHTHERHDGHGYPDGLAGQDIPIISRIVSVCDASEAISANRPYRRARSPAEALAELRRCSGTQFDPAVVTAFASAHETRLGSSAAGGPSLRATQCSVLAVPDQP
jgi:HD-GYP domain-containing protein (c-di-GMP phosphodiesterase class II)